MTQTRRDFLKRGIAFVSVGAAMPAVFVRAAYATDNNGSGSASTRKDRTLVIVQMAGGNDGLNTVVPYADSQYYNLRKNISLAATAVLPLNERIGLHPALTGFKSFWDKGRLAVVEGVGYPNPNLSHFRSMEIWHTAAPDAFKNTGWLGNYLDATHSESNSLWRAISVGRELPISMLASGSFVPAVESISAYALQTDRKYPKDQTNKLNAWAALYAQAAAEPGLGAFVG